jgi:hypothetical protein
MNLLIGLLFHQGCIVSHLLGLEVAGKAPIHRRIVQTGPESGLAEGVRIIFNKIAFRSGMHAVESPVAARAVPQRKAVMMAGYHDRIPHAGFLGQASPLLRVPFSRVKPFGQLRILVCGNFLVEHGPFPSTKYGVKSPMEEKTELGVPPPFHILIAQIKPRCLNAVPAFQPNAAFQHGGKLGVLQFLDGHVSQISFIYNKITFLINYKALFLKEK